MKQLLLIRHGKSSWDEAGTPDFERALNERGRSDAPRVAAALEERGIRPDAIVTSPAKRAAETAELVARELDFPEERIEPNRRIYLASPGVLVQVVQGLDESLETAFVFGHNPGMHETVDLLASDASVDRFPTLAVARLELTVDHWGEVDEGTARLAELILPKEMD